MVFACVVVLVVLCVLLCVVNVGDVACFGCFVCGCWFALSVVYDSMFVKVCSCLWLSLCLWCCVVCGSDVCRVYLVVVYVVCWWVLLLLCCLVCGCYCV